MNEFHFHQEVHRRGARNLFRLRKLKADTRDVAITMGQVAARIHEINRILQDLPLYRRQIAHEAAVVAPVGRSSLRLVVDNT